MRLCDNLATCNNVILLQLVREQSVPLDHSAKLIKLHVKHIVKHHVILIMADVPMTEYVR